MELSRKMVQSVPEFYAGQKILVTGGTGFMGKALVEKLLRSCPDVDTIYVIIRSKKGKSIEERWRDITNLPLFDKLKSMRPENLNKVKLIPGELSRDDLGMSNEDKQILMDNVTITFHIAADVQFRECINDVLVQNVKSTKAFLDFLVTFKQLKAFLYVSTTYCNFNRPPSESVEKILPACQDWRVLMKLQETQPNPLQLLKEKLLCGHPNAYTWSKSLCEQIVNEYSNSFPTVILRPAIVVGCINEDPITGWTDALNGLYAVALGVYTGVLRVVYTNEECYNDYVPLDTATRAQIVAAKRAAEECSKIEVYNCATAAVFPQTTKNFQPCLDEVEKRYPISQKIWATSCLYTTNPYLYYVMFLIRQVLPAIFLDFCLKLAGHKQRFKKISIRAAYVRKLFAKFSTLKHNFPIEKFKKLQEYLSENDKTDFSMHANFTNEVRIQMFYGVLKYYLKADLSEEAIKKSRKQLERILLFRKVLKTIQFSIYGIVMWNLLEWFFTPLFLNFNS